MSLLKKLNDALLEIDDNVCYGKAFDECIREHSWNIIVFNRKSINVKRKDIVRSFEVHICRESYIPEGLDIKVINAIEEKTTLKCINDTDFDYNYIRKGDSDDVVEILTLVFAKVEKCQK